MLLAGWDELLMLPELDVDEAIRAAKNLGATRCLGSSSQSTDYYTGNIKILKRHSFSCLPEFDTKSTQTPLD